MESHSDLKATHHQTINETTGQFTIDHHYYYLEI